VGCGLDKHTNLLSREFGSWLFLGSIFTSLAIAAGRSGADHAAHVRLS